MPYATTDDRVKLWYEEAGAGQPIVFVHEFAADHRSWEPQMRHFGQRYRCITYSARGYPPSDVPEKPRATRRTAPPTTSPAVHGPSQDRQGACRRPVDGRLRHPAFRLPPSPTRALSLVVAGCGYGAEKEQQAKFRAEVEVVAKSLKDEGMAKFAEKYAYGPTRVQFENKDPRGFAQFKKELGEHSALGSANTQIGVQGQRPSLYDLLDQMQALTLPTLILTGDEDWPCLAPSVLMKREIPSAALAVMPNCGPPSTSRTPTSSTAWSATSSSRSRPAAGQARPPRGFERLDRGGGGGGPERAEGGLCRSADSSPGPPLMIRMAGGGGGGGPRLRGAPIKP